MPSKGSSPYRHWQELILDPETIKGERCWAQFMRIKFDALREVGFTDDQSLDLMKAQMQIVNNNINFKREVVDE